MDAKDSGSVRVLSESVIGDYAACLVFMNEIIAQKVKTIPRSMGLAAADLNEVRPAKQESVDSI